MRRLGLLIVLLSVGFGVFLFAQDPKDSELGLPPWPVYNVVMHISDALVKIGNALKPKHVQLLQDSVAYWKSTVVRILIVTRVPEAFTISGKKEMTCPEIAQQSTLLLREKKNSKDLQLDLAFFCRILDAAAALGYLDKNPSVAPLDLTMGKAKSATQHIPTFSLTDLGQAANTLNPAGQSYFAEMITARPTVRSWFALESSVFSGRSGFAEAFDGASIWSWYEQNDPEGLQIFNWAMRDASLEAAHATMGDYNYTQCSHLCDIGGGVGTVAVEILKGNPNMRATIFDMPSSEKNALQYFKDNGVADRAAFFGGDFFKDQPPRDCDCFMLKHIIHDWPDNEAELILKNILPSLDANDRVLILEFVKGSDNFLSTEAFKNLMDLNMMANCPPGARERTAEEYDELLQKAGLKTSKVVHSRSPTSVIEAHQIRKLK